jgi:hypothetical protein
MSRKEDFPLLAPGNHRKTSPATPTYNCIAWAAGDDGRWWWPDDFFIGYWPDDAPREVTLSAFIRAYETLGYSGCDDNSLERGFEKVAIYAIGSVPTHAARQLKGGRWTSKLGKAEDIEHELGAIEGRMYGKVVVYMRRPTLTGSGAKPGSQVEPKGAAAADEARARRRKEALFKLGRSVWPLQ